jgi:hypothetical protein
VDDPGVQAAIEDLVERARRDGLHMELTIELGHGPAERHSTEMETALYRITDVPHASRRVH